MAFKLIPETEPIEVKSIVAVIFGFPGMGKTSLSFTAENPVLFDFDDGVKRAVKRKNYVQLQSWQDCIDFTNSEDYKQLQVKTIILDTAGTMLDDFIAHHVILENDKNGKKGGGVSLQGYGAMKEVFNQFVKGLKLKGLDLVIICHADTVKENDSTSYIPKLTGGSYDILIGVADLVGFLESKNNKRTLSFNPTDRHIGKNSAEFPDFIIPDYNSDEFDGWFGKLIQTTKDKMTSLSTLQLEALQKLTTAKEEIVLLEKLEDCISYEEKITEFSNKIYQIQLEKLLQDQYIKIYSDSVVEIKTTEDALKSLNSINDNKKHIHLLQKILKSKTDELKFVWDKDNKVFNTTEPEPTDPTLNNNQNDTKVSDSVESGDKTQTNTLGI